MALFDGEYHLRESADETVRDSLHDEIMYLSNIEASKVLFKHITFYQQVEKISASHVFQNLQVGKKIDEINESNEKGPTTCGEIDTHQIQIIPVLEGVMEPDNPLGPSRRVDKRSGLQDVTLSSHMPFLTLAQHICFSHLRKELNIPSRWKMSTYTHLLHGVKAARLSLLD